MTIPELKAIWPKPSFLSKKEYERAITHWFHDRKQTVGVGKGLPW